jgi:threonine synthase
VRIEGQKTAAFEICDELGDAPDFHFLPVGNAGNITPTGRVTKNITPRKKPTRCRGCLVSRRRAQRRSSTAPCARSAHDRDRDSHRQPASWQGAKNAVAESNGYYQQSHRRGNPRAYTLIARSKAFS